MKKEVTAKGIGAEGSLVAQLSVIAFFKSLQFSQRNWRVCPVSFDSCVRTAKLSQSAKAPTSKNLRVGARPVARLRVDSPILRARCISLQEGPRVLPTAPHAGPRSPLYLGHSPEWDRFLHPILEELGIEKQGFHGLRRFRVPHLESSCVPPALVKYWTGHAKSSDGEVVRQTITDRYIKMAKDTKFRADVADRIGLGFELPKAETVEAVPSVPRSQEKEVTVSI